MTEQQLAVDERLETSESAASEATDESEMTTKTEIVGSASPFQVSNAWITRSQGGEIRIDLDFRGTSAGSTEVIVSASQFALISMMMALGKPVYYSTELKAIATEPSFGRSAEDAPPQEPLLIHDVDLVWNFEEMRGGLVLELQNRSVTYFEMADPALIVGWALAVTNHDVTFDGTALVSVRDIGTNP